MQTIAANISHVISYTMIFSVGWAAERHLACKKNQWCKQDQILKTKTKSKTTESKQRHLADLTCK